MSKVLIEAYIDAVWNKKQLDVIPRVVSNDVTIHAPLGNFFGCKALHLVVSTWINAFPDLHVTIKHMASDKDICFVHYSATGTHKGDFMQIPASHNTVNFSGVAIYRFANSMITEYWSHINIYNIRTQLLAKDVLP